MKLGFAATLALATALTASTGTDAQTTIAELRQQNSVTIAGEVLQVWEDEFILKDRTGQILVEAESRPIRQANLKRGERVTVAGEFDDDDFDAISITTSAGQTIHVFDD